MKKRILIFTSTFPRWKNDTDPPFVYELARRLTKSFEIHVLTPCYPGAKRNEVIDEIRVHRYHYFIPAFEKLAGSSGILPKIKKNKLYGLLVPFFMFFGAVSLFIQCRKIKPVLIHSHWVLPQGLMTLPTHLLTKTPYCITAHGADVFALQSSIFNFLKKIVISRAAGSTAVSKALQQQIINVAGPKPISCVISMGVDATRFTPALRKLPILQEQPVTLLFVGRLSEKKGVEYLLHATKLLEEAEVDFRLTIVGSGELDSHLQQLSQKILQNTKVIFLGSLPNDNLPEIYAKHDIFIGPSITTEGGDTEGFGLTFVEAAMCGCVVIATDVGGISDIVKHMETGIIIKEKSEHSIFQAVQFCLENRQQVREIAVKGNRYCRQHYDWMKSAEQYATVYEKIMADKKDRT